MKENDISSLDHTSWRCQYHIVFASKYRRQVIYREIKVAEYIRNRLQEYEMADQMSIQEYIDPFTGSENKKA